MVVAQCTEPEQGHRRGSPTGSRRIVGGLTATAETPWGKDGV